MTFRKLNADEIEVRIGSITEKNVTLLLYKNARVDMQILDETVGAENWQREHYECKGNLFCRVGIYTPENGWVWKSDCGSESYTEKEKGEASDSFKRACVNWGIGRELYTTPRILIPKDIAGVKDGKCYTRFVCTEIGYDENGKISTLAIGKINWDGSVEVIQTYGDTKADNDLVKNIKKKDEKLIEEKIAYLVSLGKDESKIRKALDKEESKLTALDKWIVVATKEAKAPSEYKRTES